MHDLGQALLKLAEQRGQSQRESRERSARQLARLLSKVKDSRKKLGKRLEETSKELKKSLARKGLPALLKRLFQPWRRYSDQRQLALIEILQKWHQAESDEIIQTLKTLTSDGQDEPAAKK